MNQKQIAFYTTAYTQNLPNKSNERLENEIILQHFVRTKLSLI